MGGGGRGPHAETSTQGSAELSRMQKSWELGGAPMYLHRPPALTSMEAEVELCSSLPAQ